MFSSSEVGSFGYHLTDVFGRAPLRPCPSSSGSKGSFADSAASANFPTSSETPRRPGTTRVSTGDVRPSRCSAPHKTLTAHLAAARPWCRSLAERYRVRRKGFLPLIPTQWSLDAHVRKPPDAEVGGDVVSAEPLTKAKIRVPVGRGSKNGDPAVAAGSAPSSPGA